MQSNPNQERCCEKCGYLKTQLGTNTFRKPVCIKEDCECHTQNHSTMEGVVEAFDRGFVFEGMNGGPNEPLTVMYRVNEDGTRTLATREYIVAFLKVALAKERESAERRWIEAAKQQRLEDETSGASDYLTGRVTAISDLMFKVTGKPQ